MTNIMYKYSCTKTFNSNRHKFQDTHTKQLTNIKYKDIRTKASNDNRHRFQDIRTK